MKTIRSAILFLAIASFAPDAFGQGVWVGSAKDNQWATGLNWSTGAEPTTSATFNSTTVNVNLPGVPTTLGNIYISNNSVIGLNATTSAFTTTYINVDSASSLTLNIPAGGQVNTTNPTFSNFIGDGMGTGTLTLTGSGTFNATAPASEGFAVGIGGVGTVTQSGSTSMIVGGTLFIGADGNSATPASVPLFSNVATGGTGNYYLGGTATLNAGVIDIGTGSGTGSGNVTGGSTATAGVLYITSTNGSALTAGTVNLGVAVGQMGATIATTTGAVYQSAGTAAITTLNVGFAPGTSVGGAYYLSGTGILNTTTITLGNTAGATGTFQQSDTSSVSTTGNLSIGQTGSGSYNLEAGTLNVGGNLVIGGGTGTSSMTQAAGSVTVAGAFTLTSGTFNFNGGSLTIGTGLTVSANGTFYQNAAFTTTAPITITNSTYNQNASFTPAANSITLTGSTYNLGGGTLTGGVSTIFTAGSTGTFNFAGGTVAGTGTWSDPFSGTITGNGGISNSGGTATLTGNMTGTGTLNISGGGIVALTPATGVNSGSWGAVITGGSTLNATNGINSISNSGNFVIGGGSTFNLASTGAATDTFAGTVSDKADLAGQQANFNIDTNNQISKLVIANTALSTNSATIIGTGGSLQVNNGFISNINGSAGNALDTFDVGGTGATAAIATVTLLGTNNLPLTTVNPGSTLFAGNLAGGANNSLFNNNGTVGTLGTFNNPSSLLIANNFTSVGTLLVNTNPVANDTFGTAANPITTATVSGQIKVNGIGTNSRPIIFTTGGITIGGNGMLNNSAGLSTNPPTPLFSSSLSLNGNQLILSTRQNLFIGFAQTPNEAAVANALDPVIVNNIPASSGFGNVLHALNQFTQPAAITAALEQMSPESLQYSRDISFENSTFLAQRMNNVCADLRDGSTGLDTSGISVVDPSFDSGLGRSLGSLMAYAPFHAAAPNGVNYYPDTGASPYPSSAPLSAHTSSASPSSDSSGESISDSPTPFRTASESSTIRMPSMNEFIAGDVVQAQINQGGSSTNSPSSKASYLAGDAIAGVSFRMTSNLSAGILFDYNNTSAKTDSAGSRTTVNTYSPGVYATYFTHGFYVNGLFSFGVNNYSNTRDIGFLGSQATSSPTGEQYVSNLDFGYDFHPEKEWIVGPTAGMTYTHLDIDSFSESGAGPLDLTVNSQSLDSLRSQLGGHLIYQTHTGNVLFQPNVTAMWQHEFLNDSDAITSQFNIPGTTPFTIQGATATKNSALIGCGLTATLDNSMALYLNYLADVGADNYFAQTVIGGFKASF